MKPDADDPGGDVRFCSVLTRCTVDRLIRQSGPARKRLGFLVLSGSFNPIHTQHTTLLKAAKHHVERTGWCVLAGFLAPSSDQHVRRKLGSRAFPLIQRIALCRLAVSGLDWAHVCVHGEQSSKWVTRCIREELEDACRQSLNGRRLSGIEIMGSDTLARLFEHVVATTGGPVDAQDDRIICYVSRRAVPSILDLDRASKSVPVGIRLMRVEPSDGFDPESPISSTAIRDLIAERKWSELRSKGWLHPAVFDALRRFS